MPAQWESQGTDTATSTSDTVLDVPKPSGLAVGDLLIAFGSCVSSRTISAPAGWTTVVNDNTGAATRLYIWTKIATSTEVAASTLTFTASGSFAAQQVSCHRVSSPSTNAITTGVSGSGTNSTTHTCPSVTTPSNNCLVFWIQVDGLSTSNQTTADKGTERLDQGFSTGGPGHMSVYTNLEPTAGSITGAVITTSGASITGRTLTAAVESAAGSTARVRSSPMVIGL